MRKPLSHHSQSISFLKSASSNSNHQQVFYENFIQQTPLTKSHSNSQSKIILSTKQSNTTYNSYLTSSNLTKNPNNQLKRTSMLKNKHDLNKSTNQKYHLFNSKQQTQSADSNNMFLTNIQQKQISQSQEITIKKLFNQISYQSTYTSGSTTPKGKITIESKWQKIIQLYTMREQLAKKFQFPSAIKLRKKYPILPSGQFYKILAKSRVFEKQWKINFPQTIFQDLDGNIVMIYTDLNGILRKKTLQKEGEKKQKYREEVLKWKRQLIQELQKKGKINLFKQIKIQQNPNAPLSIMKYTEDNAYQFETDVQSYRNFVEKKLRPTRDSIMQRYIYSNNLKAMIFRLYYNRQTNGTVGSPNKPQYTGIRFQNQKCIFKESASNSFCDIHKLTSTITLSNQRINSMKYMPINNPKTLLKYISIAKEIQKLLEYSQKLLIDKLYIDFIVDVFDKPWLINIKYCEINPNSMIRNPIQEDHTDNVGLCRLCGVVVRKKQLQNSVSVRMLCEFIHHIKKRTKHQDLHKIEFIKNLNINSMENKSSSVCKICYQVIIHELQLIKMQKKLAQICNIIPSSSQDYLQPDHKTLKTTNNIGQYKQWRLMLYFEDIKNVQIKIQQSSTSYLNSRSFYHGNDNFSKNENVKTEIQYFLKYQLCPKISQSFFCKKQNLGTNLNINQVKLHYFYSEDTIIQQFINNTEIIVSLYSAQVKTGNNLHTQSDNQYDGFDKITDKYEKVYHNEKLLASGSTHILSNFNLYKSSSCSLKTLMENGQKQTATVLLFFQNRKYCELTLKVGLVFDGSYNVNNIPTKRENNSNQISQFIKWKQVWFSRNLWNSNPLPKQWMQIFGSKYNYDSSLNPFENEDNLEDLNEQEILKRILNNPDNQNYSDNQY